MSRSRWGHLQHRTLRSPCGGWRAYYAAHCCTYRWQHQSMIGTNLCPPQKAMQGSHKGRHFCAHHHLRHMFWVYHPPPPNDGGYLSDGDSVQQEKFTMHDPTPQCRLEGKGLATWMDDRHICAYEEVVWCMAQALEQSAWSKTQGAGTCVHLVRPVLNFWHARLWGLFHSAK